MELPKSTITKEQQIAILKDKIHKLENNSKDNISIQKKLQRQLRKLED
jgi:hypothetical protein